MSYIGSGYLSYTTALNITCARCGVEFMKDCFVDDMGDVDEQVICPKPRCKTGFNFRTEV